MSDEENEIEVKLEEAKTEEPAVVIEEEPVKKQEKPEVSPDEAIQDLKKRLELERIARSEAERRAIIAQQHAAKAQEETVDTQYQLVSNAIDTLKSKSEQLKAAMREAHNAGDIDAIADIQEAISLNTSQLEKLKDGEKAMKKHIQDAEERSKHANNVAQQQQGGDIIDQIIANVAQSSPKSAAWLQDNRDTIKTDRDVRKMLRAHEDAIDDGIQADTPEYFEFVERRLGIRREESQSESVAAPRKSVPPPSAPVSRGGSRPNVMRLSAAEAETAKALGMTPEEYAKNKVLLQKEGRYGH